MTCCCAQCQTSDRLCTVLEIKPSALTLHLLTETEPAISGRLSTQMAAYHQHCVFVTAFGNVRYIMIILLQALQLIGWRAHLNIFIITTNLFPTTDTALSHFSFLSCKFQYSGFFQNQSRQWSRIQYNCLFMEDSGKVQKESSRAALAGCDPGSLWFQRQESKPPCVSQHKWGSFVLIKKSLYIYSSNVRCKSECFSP